MPVNKSETPVYIIDGSSFLYRAYYSVRPLTTKQGVQVNAVYGFCRMIKKLIDSYDPSHVVLVWDSKGKTVRHELYPAYKETRQATPNDLMAQKELIQEFADIIGLKQLSMDAIEADDLMFSVAKQLEQQGSDSIVISSDKDLGQVLSGRITILDPFKDTIITKESLEEKLGFPLEKLPFYFALVGDSSDNIPGVKGIGPKGATTLVQQFSSLEDLYQHLDQVSSERIRGLLEASKDNALLSKQLFTLQMYDTQAEKNKYTFQKEGWGKAIPLFEKYGFKSLLKGVSITKKVTLHETYDFQLVTSQEQLAAVCKEIKEAGICALDTETTGLDPVESAIVGISVCSMVGKAYYIPFGHTTSEQQLSKEQVIEQLKPIFEDPAIEKYLHHSKFDELMLSQLGIHLTGVTYDTLLAASLGVDANQRISLKALSEDFLDEPMLTFEDVVKRKGYKTFAQVPLQEATDYAAADAHQTLKLVAVCKKLLAEKGLTSLFEDLEMPVMEVLSSMERRGILLDIEVLEEINRLVSLELESIRGQIIEFIGDEHAALNLNSPKQLGILLFEHLQLPVMKKTAKKTGYSTDQEVLEQLAKVHPVPGLVMKYREYYKLKSTYLDALGTYVHPETKAIHTTYSQTGVATGRLASSNPNLQNIPVDQFNIRSAFKPREGNVFLSADYSQIELRVLAYVSQDETLLTAFKEDKDIHALTAAGLFSIDQDKVSSHQRQIGKRINFSILYGLTAHGLSKDLDVSHSVAKSYIETFMAQYPGVLSWMESVVDFTKEHGYVETVLGRRRYLPGIYERNRTLYDMARRVAINTVAQGTAAELMKKGMIRLATAFTTAGSHAQMLLQIHDELLIEVPHEEVEQTKELVTQVLESIVDWNVPLKVTTRTGSDWQDVTK